MRSRTVEIVLILAAAGLFIWRMVGAFSRGAPSAYTWTSYELFGLIVLCAVNIFVRSKTIALTLASACALLVLLVVLAALLGTPHENPIRSPAFLRSSFFFLAIVIASLMQTRPHHP